MNICEMMPSLSLLMLWEKLMDYHPSTQPYNLYKLFHLNYLQKLQISEVIIAQHHKWQAIV